MRTHRMRTLIAVMIVVIAGSASAAFAATSEVQKIQQQIRDLKNDVRRAGEAYSDAYWALEKTRGKLAALDKKIAATQAKLDAASARLSARAADMYRTGGADYLAVLLSADDFDEMLTRLEYVQRIGQNDAEIIAEVEQLRADLTAKRDELARLKGQQAEEAARLKKQADRIQRQLKSKQAEYNRLQKRLAAAIAAERARTGRTTARPGPNGMVFPVAGPCYYNDTWGAARSGGRTHKGTDIMAPRGTPVVAVLSGTVRAKSSSLGGLTIWLTADNGWAFYYAHLDSYTVTSGRVRAGQKIGEVGDTGNARGGSPHLHFEIHPNGGAAVNPYPYLRQMQ